MQQINSYRLVAIPLKQGQVFNDGIIHVLNRTCVAIPLKQGQVFNFLFQGDPHEHSVAIPLKQGQVFNDDDFDDDVPF